MQNDLADSHGEDAWDGGQMIWGIHESERGEADVWGAAGAPEQRNQPRLRINDVN